ncbi:MAG TPA: HlyD family efflux transporter periplasmic adaptor subunit [Acetobacteraceae bacterium]|nr:HlyD family efflux transporter periplasmic adaptor subunit [Acetobacteraceae bacterium]
MPTSRLFRAEAIAHQRDPLAGSAALPVPPSAASLTWLVLALLAAASVVLAGGSYARKETAPGFLTPTIGVAKVLPPRAGVVVAVAVIEGERVEAGTPLLTVQVGQTDENGSDVDSGVLQSIGRQRSSLLQQIELEQAKTTAEHEQVQHRIDGLRAEIVALQAELAAQHERTQVADEQVVAVRDLVKQGYISVVEFKHRQDNLLAQRQNEAALVRQIVERQGVVTQQSDALHQLPDSLAARILVLRASISDLDGRLAEIAGRRAYLLRASVAGQVSALQARVGLTADPTVPLLSIVPTGSILQAELFVPARAIGFVEAGQTVRLAYEAFPFQRFGLHGGRVISVSRNLLRPAELIAPIAIGEPSYRVTVSLDRQSLPAFGREFPLGPDMTLRADIVFDRRSLLAWVFEPLLSLRGRWS